MIVSCERCFSPDDVSWQPLPDRMVLYTCANSHDGRGPHSFVSSRQQISRPEEQGEGGVTYDLLDPLLSCVEPGSRCWITASWSTACESGSRPDCRARRRTRTRADRSERLAGVQGRLGGRLRAVRRGGAALGRRLGLLAAAARRVPRGGRRRPAARGQEEPGEPPALRRPGRPGETAHARGTRTRACSWRPTKRSARTGRARCSCRSDGDSALWERRRQGLAILGHWHPCSVRAV